MSYAPRVVIFAREPVAGRVKTRLGREIGIVAASRCYRLMLARSVRQVADRRWQTILAVTPDSAIGSRALPAACRRLPQGRGDLGVRMQRVLDWACAGPIVIIGSDIPAIDRHDIAAAFKALGHSDAVIGPSGDGGYWLIGLKRLPRVLRPFANVRWSTQYALTDTLANLAGCKIARLRSLDDVDTASDLARWQSVIGRLSGAPRGAA